MTTRTTTKASTSFLSFSTSDSLTGNVKGWSNLQQKDLNLLISSHRRQYAILTI